MARKPFHPLKAYDNKAFLDHPNARPIRILSEYLEPKERFEELGIRDTILFFGSARVVARDQAETELKAAKSGKGDVEAAEMRLEMSRYYEATRELAHRLTEWSKGLTGTERRFVVCSGGGPGIMEAANRGASEARGENVGLCISLPHESSCNPYITRSLAFEFHYFFMRKFWFLYMAKAMVIMPGGFGTLDELMEALTLIQTFKMKKRMPIVLFGKSFWEEVIDFAPLVRYGMISAGDTDLMRPTDSVDEAFTFITEELLAHALDDPEVAL
jgi:uncharacterized protein (TIGR00730 family)